MAGLKNYEVRDALLRHLGIETVGSASAAMLEDVRDAMNYAEQTLWMAGPDYFTRTQTSVTLVAGTAAYTLADTVQGVLGPVRTAGGRTLRALESRSEFDNFWMLYMGQTSPTVVAGTPLAYFVENIYEAGDDPVLIKIHFVPKPDSTAATEGAAVVEGVSDCTLFSTADIAGTSVLPVAQQYVETLFLPLARKRIARSVYFSSQELDAKIEADFLEAMAVLSRAGGFPPVADESKAKRQVAA